MKSTTLIDCIEKELNYTETENGAKTHISTLNSCLDLFTQGSTCRNNINELCKLVKKSFFEDKLQTLKCLFYLRDIRGNSGQGERLIFREGLKEIIRLSPESIMNVLVFISEYGRWDDLISLLGINSRIDDKISEIVRDQLVYDTTHDDPSLLAKWLPSCNCSSLKTRKLSKILRDTKFMKMNVSEYRKLLSLLRKKINILETKLCKKEYDFNYSNVPSNAMMKYNKLFYKRDLGRFSKYIEDLKNNVNGVKINANTLYPFDIVNKIYNDKIYSDDKLTNEQHSLYELAWKSLPNYLEGNEHNGLVVCDVSGSMYGKPLDVAISMALYIAERNTGNFHNVYMTFSKKPNIIKINDNQSLKEKIEYIMSTDIGYNTDLYAVFEVLLKTAIDNELSDNDMPKVIYIISDMQFDRQISNFNKTALEQIREDFTNSHLTMPKIVYWNVADESKGNTPSTKFDDNVVMIGGSKPSCFESILSCNNPLEFMIKVLNSERYNKIQ